MPTLINAERRLLRSAYLDHLPVPVEQTALLDVYPVYLVKRAGRARKRREQGDAIDAVYNSAVPDLPPLATGPVQRSDLPSRLTSRALPVEAAHRFGRWILDILDATGAEHLVTLGQEPCTTLTRLPGLEVQPPATSLAATRTSGYDSPRSITHGGRSITWTPLAHPGLIRQSNPETPGSWAAVHREWTEGTT